MGTAPFSALRDLTSLRVLDANKPLPPIGCLQCRERYVHHLAPGLQVSDWRDEEDAVIFAQIQVHGTKWIEVAKALPGRCVGSSFRPCGSSRTCVPRQSAKALTARRTAPHPSRPLPRPPPPSPARCSSAQAVKNRYYSTCRRIARAKTKAGQPVLGLPGMAVAAGGSGLGAGAGAGPAGSGGRR